LFSLYDAVDSDADPTFQIDANLGYPAAVMNALVQVPDVASASMPLTVTLLPALPRSWSSGSLRGARIRGGMALDMQWEDSVPTRAIIRVDHSVTPRLVRVVWAGASETFWTSEGMVKTVVFRQDGR